MIILPYRNIGGTPFDSIVGIFVGGQRSSRAADRDLSHDVVGINFVGRGVFGGGGGGERGRCFGVG